MFSGTERSGEVSALHRATLRAACEVVAAGETTDAISIVVPVSAHVQGAMRNVVADVAAAYGLRCRMVDGVGTITIRLRRAAATRHPASRGVPYIVGRAWAKVQRWPSRSSAT
jgi:hypothetical protein